MDLSALIFVALAVAWAVYLIPKALRHHEDDARSRTVDRFSDTMRVLARREPVSRQSARLVVTPGRPASTVREVPVEAPAVVKPEPAPAPALLPAASPGPTPAPQPPTPATAQSRRRAAASAAKRRRRVLLVILVALLAVVGVCAFGLIAWAYVAIPAALLVAWLVACRLMVKKERAVRRPARVREPAEPTRPSADLSQGGHCVADGVEVPTATTSTLVREAQPTAGPAPDPAAEPARVGESTGASPAPVTSSGAVDPALWDPVPVTLPTYVTKPAATRRTVRTIDLDDTGVWTSGRTEADSRLARDADDAERADKSARAASTDGDDHRAVGS